ncbi:MAG: prepilin-type N-terminal cleavage/methylation domain-containing protein [Nitrospirae bacterium]|nr:prepilin-type N-terminal cleavage/methylation domain-containing protein [Nitrospirota bacterium]
MRYRERGQGVKGSGVRKTVHCSLFTVHHFPTLRERAGFTLLEIMIALAIIGTILLTVIYTVNYHAQLSYEHTLATRIFLFAKEKMAELEMNPKNEKGISPDKDFSYENTVRDTNNNNIIELKTMVKGYGKEVMLSEFVFKKANKN